MEERNEGSNPKKQTKLKMIPAESAGIVSPRERIKRGYP
jgi:hypothetical protein